MSNNSDKQSLEWLENLIKNANTAEKEGEI